MDKKFKNVVRSKTVHKNVVCDKVIRENIVRGPNKAKKITGDRKLVSRKEAADILGCHYDTLKKLEVRRGGPLEVVRLYPKARTVFYRIEDIDRLINPTSKVVA